MEIQELITGMKSELVGQIGGFKTELDQVKSQAAQQQTQLDAIDAKSQRRHIEQEREDPLRKALEGSAELKRLMEVGKGSAIIPIDLSGIQLKTLITGEGLGAGTAGINMPGRTGGDVGAPLAQRRLFMRDLLSKGEKTTASSVYFVRETGFTNNASPQGGQGELKGESAMTFDTVTRDVRTIAHWIPVSSQALADVSWLDRYIRRKLLYGLRLKEDAQILAGSGTGQNLDGIIPQAAAFDTGLLSGSWNKADVLRRALQQIEAIDEAPVGFFVLHPDDWADLELMKDSEGRYLIGDPASITTPRVWGRPVVVTNQITSGTFLAGSTESADLIDRLDATIEVSNSHSDFFVRNKVAILCEERVVLTVSRPEAFVTGSLTSSPA